MSMKCESKQMLIRVNHKIFFNGFVEIKKVVKFISN